jgi:putative intracellular protease/amidase
VIKHVLMIVTSVARIVSTGAPTGIWLEELAAAYFRFRDAAWRVEIVSIAGGPGPLDPASLEAPWLTESGRRFLSDSTAMAQLASTASVAVASSQGITAIYLVGGVGTAWDFPGNEALAALIERVHSDGGVVSGVCHGVLGLTKARAPDGRALIANRRVTGVSNVEEKIVGLDAIVPHLPEETMRSLGAQYSCAAEPFGAHVVRDGRLLTGQNPASAAPLAEAVIATLEESSLGLDCKTG